MVEKWFLSSRCNFSVKYCWLLNVKLPLCAIFTNITVNTPKMCTRSRPCVFTRLLYLDHIQRERQTYLWIWPCFAAKCFVEMLAILDFWASGEGYKWKPWYFVVQSYDTKWISSSSSFLNLGIKNLKHFSRETVWILLLHILGAKSKLLRGARI